MAGMRIGIQTWGSEGDVRPLVALIDALAVCPRTGVCMEIGRKCRLATIYSGSRALLGCVHAWAFNIPTTHDRRTV